MVRWPPSSSQDTSKTRTTVQHSYSQLRRLMLMDWSMSGNKCVHNIREIIWTSGSASGHVGLVHGELAEGAILELFGLRL